MWKKQHVFRRYYLPGAAAVVAVLVRTTVAAKRKAADKDVVHDVQHLEEEEPVLQTLMVQQR